MSKINSGGLLTFKNHSGVVINGILILLGSLFIALLMQLSLPEKASAAPTTADATAYCNKTYPGGSGTVFERARNACINGYLNGNGQGQICGQYDSEPEVIIGGACRVGYNEKDRKEKEAGGNQSTQPAPTTPTPSTPPATSSPDDGADSDPNDKDAVTCAVEKIGWIVCPIIEQSAKMSDKLFQFLAGSFLEIEPELLKGDSGTKDAWVQALNLANIAFVIVFVIIVISQVTGAGLSNYGIKRMLPRLIVAAIAVNASYWICQGMVDLSNLLGYNIMDALTQIARSVGPSAFDNNQQASNTMSGEGFLGSITVAVLAAAAVVWLFLAIMGGTIFIVLITCIVIVIILLMRKAFIILLVVVAPFAFVAYLLPNTEKFFSKWLDMFWKLLMVFPIVALLLGGGQLASAIILKAGSDVVNPTPNAQEQEQIAAEEEACKTPDTTQKAVENNGYEVKCEPKVENVTSSGEVRESGAMIGLIAAGVAVAPLLAVWAVLKGALAAAGAIGGKIAGAIQNGGNRFGKAGSGKMGDRMGRTSLGRGMAARKQIKQRYKDDKFAGKMGSSGRRGRMTRFAARGAGGNAGLLAEKAGKTGVGEFIRVDKMTGGIQAQNSKLSAGFAGAAQKAMSEDIQNDMAALNRSDDPIANASKQLQEAMKNGDTVGAKSAQNVLMSSGGKGMDEFVNAMAKSEIEAIGKGNGPLINALRQNALQNHGSTMKEKSGVAAGWAGGGASDTMSRMQSNPGSNPFKGLSDEQISKQTVASIDNALSNGHITRETAERITKGSVGENLGQAQRQMLQDHASGSGSNREHGPERPPTP